MQHLAHGIVRGGGIAQLEVPAQGAAEKGIALRNIDQVAPGAGRTKGGPALHIVELHTAAVGLQQGQDQAQQRRLTGTGLTKDSCRGTGREIQTEML